MSASSYYDVQHEGGPLGGQQVTYAGEPKLRLAKHGGTYVRETLRDETADGTDTPLRAYRYRWEPADANGPRVPQDGDDASAMLADGPITLPEGASMAVSFSGTDEGQDEGGSETGGNVKSQGASSASSGTSTSAKQQGTQGDGTEAPTKGTSSKATSTPKR